MSDFAVARLGPDASPQRNWQALYRFSVGLPRADSRVVSEPPYGPAREEPPQ